jgi:copper chaperone CopZ
MTKLALSTAAVGLVALLAGTACDKHQAGAAPSERRAAASAEPSPVVVVSAAPTGAAAKPVAGADSSAAEEATCGGEMQAGGECAGGCDQWDEAAANVARRPIPADAAWEEIAVAGMTCGGCERRVIANVGQIDGVLAVEADAELGQVRVAMAPGRGRDLRRAAVQRINSLGYQAR